MKKIHIVFIVFVLTLSLVSCGSTPEPAQHPPKNGYSVAADWVMYDTLSSINESADCIIVAKVLSQNSTISVGYSASDFENFSSLIET